jgi:hypothetical protein
MGVTDEVFKDGNPTLSGILYLIGPHPIGGVGGGQQTSGLKGRIVLMFRVTHNVNV